jgi:uncharacterized protein (DUF433 family)
VYLLLKRNIGKFDTKKIMIDWTLHIETDPEKLFGKPVIINTRIPVDLILEKLAIGDTVEDLIDAYPKISKDDITACLLFAADSIKNEIVYSKAS